MCLRRIVFDGLHRVQPQAVEMILANPVQRVLHDEAAHMLAASSVVVHRFSPRRFVVRGKVRTEVAQVIAFWPEMVVDHVENHRQPDAMRGIDESLKAFGTTVVRLHGVGRDAVIPPIAHARKSGYRHHLDHRDPQLLQVLQLRDSAVEGAIRREGPDVQFVNNVIAESEPAPSIVAPLKRRRIDDLGWAVHTLGEEARHRIRNRRTTVENVGVTIARSSRGDGNEIFTIAPHRNVLPLLRRRASSEA